MEYESKRKRSEYLKSRQYASFLGNRLRQARAWSGLQYGDVADILEVDREEVRKIEKGRWLPTVYELVVLGDLYGCSIDWVLGLSDDPKTREEHVEAAKAASLVPAENLEAIDRDRCEGERFDDRYDAPESQAERKRMCLSKRRFRTEESALKAAINSSRLYVHVMRPYRCPVCNGWHLTSHELPEFDPLAFRQEIAN